VTTYAVAYCFTTASLEDIVIVSETEPMAQSRSVLPTAILGMLLVSVLGVVMLITGL
jgi:hypothetical protein